MTRCSTCPVKPSLECVAVATRCSRLCFLASTDPAYQQHILNLSDPCYTPSPAFPAPGPAPEDDALRAVFACPHRSHCRCSVVECNGGKRAGQRVNLAQCLECVNT
jgi:hypothetical protein